MSKRRDNKYTAQRLKRELLKSMSIDKEELISITYGELKDLEVELDNKIYMYKLLTSFLEYLIKEN